MILQALYEYYQRKGTDQKSALAPEGFEFKEIPFYIVLGNDGHFVQFDDMREGGGKKKRAKSALVPKGVKRARGIAANLLWDNAEYVLGVDAPDKPSKAAPKHTAFVARLRETFGAEPPATVGVVLTFLAHMDLDVLRQTPQWSEIVETNAMVSFRLQGDTVLVCERSDVRAAMVNMAVGEQPDFCPVSGGNDEIERLHPAIKGVWGAQTSGANIVSFNLPAFCSWGKGQGDNAPVGKKASFAYTTALNHLLGKDSRQRMQVGDASTVFWAEKAVPLENDFDAFFGEPRKGVDDPDRFTQAVKRLYESVHSGTSHLDEAENTRFYVLGLAPNAARIAVRFWHIATVRELDEKLRLHFDDTKIDHAPFEPDSLPLMRLIAATALLGKYDNITPNMAGETMKTVLNGTPYPMTLAQATLRRIRAEQAKRDERTGKPVPNVSYPRAALLKAWLNRYIRQSQPYEKEITVSLDKNNTNIGYRLGCLFAALERIQEDASSRKLNSTIRDRFYGTASSTPIVVFAALMRLNQHHMSVLRKGKPGLFVERDKLLSQIINNGLDGKIGFPPTLRLQDQGRFAIGYYHQRQDFFKLNQGE